MKCIWAIQGFFIWVILCLAVALFTPDSLSVVSDNFWWIAGFGFTAWWLAGYFVKCD